MIYVVNKFVNDFVPQLALKILLKKTIEIFTVNVIFCMLNVSKLCDYLEVYCTYLIDVPISSDYCPATSSVVIYLILRRSLCKLLLVHTSLVIL